MTTVPHGQLADSSQMYPVHRMFRREFSLVPAAVRRVAPGDAVQTHFVVSAIERLNLLLHEHHIREDKYLWPRLLDRVGDELTPIVHLVEYQHERIEQLYHEANDAAEIWHQTLTKVDRDTVATVYELLVPALLEHMTVEEGKVLGLIDRFILQSEWDQMTTEPSRGDPRDLPVLLGMLMYESAPHEFEEAFARMPPAFADEMRAAAPRAYTEFAEQMYGTAIPPRSS